MKRGIPKELLFKQVATYAHNRRTLDIGCGNKAYSNVSHDVVTLDGWSAVNPDHLIDLEIEDLPFKKNEFECILMLDFIEHMTKARGKQILEQAKTITSDRIYLLTPLWWDTNEQHTNDPTCWAYGNEMNIHRSFWGRQDFSDWIEIGFEVDGDEYYFGYWEKS